MGRVKEEMDTMGYFDNREPDIDAIEEERFLQEQAAKADEQKFKEAEQDDSHLENNVF